MKKERARYYPKWVGNLLMVWLPGLFYLTYLMLTRRPKDSWVLGFILPVYFLVIYLFKRQKIPEEAKPVYIPKIRGYIFSIVLFALFAIAIIASIERESILAIILLSYVFLPIIIASYLVSSHRLPEGDILKSS